MTPERTEAEYAAYMLWVASGEECQHPEAFRHPIPNRPNADPKEWECGGCGTWQMRAPEQPE
jgi:hypothetical protein